jgi:hypothetical protein
MPQRFFIVKALLGQCMVIFIGCETDREVIVTEVCD